MDSSQVRQTAPRQDLDGQPEPSSPALPPTCWRPRGYVVQQGRGAVLHAWERPRKSWAGGTALAHLKRKSPNRACLGVLRGPPGDPPHTRFRQMIKISKVSKKATERRAQGGLRTGEGRSEVKQPDARANRESLLKGSQRQGQPKLARANASRMPDLVGFAHN